MTELGILAQQVGVSERTLLRAVSQGTLQGERRSPRRLRISAEEKSYVRRWWETLARARGVLRTERNVRFAVLFGSAARGDARPESDIDVLVELEDEGLERIIELRAKLRDALGREVDLVVLENAEEEPGLLSTILEDGRVLVDREGRWEVLRGEAEALQRRGRRWERQRVREALAGIDRLRGATDGG